MKLSKIKIVIKYDLQDKYSSIYAHIFEHILVSCIEDKFKLKDAMVYAFTNFDYIYIDIQMLKGKLKKIFCALKNLFHSYNLFLKCFNKEKNILLREKALYEETDAENILIKMLESSLKVKSLSVQGTKQDISHISKKGFIEFLNKNIIMDNIILEIDKKIIKPRKNNMPIKNNLIVQNCDIKRKEEYCSVVLIIPDMRCGENKNIIELLEYLNFSENRGLFKLLREEKGYIYNLEHAYVFVQNLYMLIVEIKCEKEYLNQVLMLINDYLKNQIYENLDINSVLNHIKVLKMNEQQSTEKQSIILFNKLINKESDINHEIKELQSISIKEFKEFLKCQKIYIGVAE